MPHMIIAIACATIFSVIFSILQKNRVNINVAMLANYITGAIFSGITVLFKMASDGVKDSSFLWPGYAIPALALITGIIYSTGFLIRDIGTAHCGVSISTIITKVSFIVPVILSWLLLADKEPSWLSIALILISIGMISFKKEEAQQKFDPAGLGILFLLFLTYGMSEFFLKYARTISGESGNIAEIRLSCFMTLIFVFAAITSLCLCIAANSFRKSEHIVKDCLYGVFIGTVNAGNTAAIISSLGKMPASYFYPVYNIAVVLLCTVVGTVFLKERLSMLQIIGTILAALSIILFYSI